MFIFGQTLVATAIFLFPVFNPQSLVNIRPPDPSQEIREIIVSYARLYGVDEQIATKIAECESELKQFNSDGSILRGIINSKDVGVFQINEFYHPNQDIYTAEGNIKYAVSLMVKDGLSAWNWSKNCWSK